MAQATDARAIRSTGYFGSKASSGLGQAIIAMMPAHEVYIETHLGGGTVLKHKPPSRMSIGIDLDSNALEAFEETADAIRGHVELMLIDAHEFLEAYDFRGRELVYADPPYLLETRTSSRRYRHDYTAGQHRDLIALLGGLPCPVILSGYRSGLYDELLEGWFRTDLQVMSRGGGVRTECLWRNFEKSGGHWAWYAGRDFTDRQRIKRKASRWALRYERMPKLERLAVLAAIMAVEARESTSELEASMGDRAEPPASMAADIVGSVSRIP